MRTRPIISIVVLVVLAAVMMMPPAHANRTIFYDNFQSTALGPQWFYANLHGNPSIITTSAGGVSMTSLRAPAASPPGGISEIIANQTDPVFNGVMVTASNPSVLINAIFFMLPMNISAASTIAGSLDAFVLFGFADSASQCINIFSCGTAHLTPPHWFGFEVEQVGFNIANPSSLPPSAGTTQTRVIMNRPSTDTSFASGGSCFGTAFTTCSHLGFDSDKDNASRYDTKQSPIDPTVPHVFQLTMQLRYNGLSWMAASVDNMAVLNYTDTSGFLGVGNCRCIGTNFLPLYPFVEQYVQWNAVPPTSPSTSVGYISITDYVPLNPPRVFLPGPTAPVPSGIPQGTGPSYFQGMAAQLGGGNTYVGGLFLTIVTMIVVSMIMAFVFKIKIPLFHTMSALAIIGIGVFLGIDTPFLLIAGIVAVVASFVGVLPSGGSSGVTET